MTDTTALLMALIAEKEEKIKRLQKSNLAICGAMSEMRDHLIELREYLVRLQSRVEGEESRSFGSRLDGLWGNDN